MGKGFLIDTNVIIDALNNALPQKAMAFIMALPPVISDITRMELLGWTGATPAQLAPVEAFTSKATLLPISETVILKVIDIRKVKKIKLGDAIIAATALVNSVTLISRNTSDFTNIAGLTVIDPYTI